MEEHGTSIDRITTSRTQNDEPPMFIQRPSSARSQDISHVLAGIFRDAYTRDVVAPDTVKYLHQSRGGEDPYHEKYVKALHEVNNAMILKFCNDFKIF